MDAAKGLFQKPLGRLNFVDRFSIGFSLITRDRSTLQTCKLAQKILYAILHQMMYNLSGYEQYLKSQLCEIGRFSCILGVFPIFPFLTRKNGGRGLWNWHEKLQISDIRWRCLIFIFKSIKLIVFKLIYYSFNLHICVTNFNLHTSFSN